MTARDKDKLCLMAVFYTAIICGSLTAGSWIIAGLAACQWAFMTCGLVWDYWHAQER